MSSVSFAHFWSKTDTKPASKVRDGIVPSGYRLDRCRLTVVVCIFEKSKTAWSAAHVRDCNRVEHLS